MAAFPEATRAKVQREFTDPDRLDWHFTPRSRNGVALKELDPGHGELKSMRVDAAARGRGHGARMLDHVLAEARRRGYSRVSLETGSMAFFAAAHRLYTRSGFVPCPPFADYLPDPNSIFLTLALDGAAQVASSRPTSRR